MKSYFLTCKETIFKTMASKRSPLSVYFMIGDEEVGVGEVKAETFVGFFSRKKQNKMII